MRRLALTSWSVHHSLGAPSIRSHVADGGPTQFEPTKHATLALTELPARMHEAGIGTLELCHFHFPSTAPEYLRELRAAIENAHIELFTILIDAGDISNPDAQQRAADVEMIKSWIDVAATVGAQGVRVVAGDGAADDHEALMRSADELRQLAAYAAEPGVRVRTENFKSLTSTAANCNALLDALGGAIGLCADMGNFPATVRVDEFTKVIPRADVVHTKASYDANGQIAPQQLYACLDAAIAAGFEGPYTLVFDRPGDEWNGIMTLKEHVATRIG